MSMASSVLGVSIRALRQCTPPLYSSFRPIWALSMRAPLRASTVFNSSASCKRFASVLEARYYSTQAEPQEDYHTIIKNTEKGSGAAEKREFQAETRMLLDIVAKSLYSEKEIFIRELISNASDALEKLRYLRLTSEGQVSGGGVDSPLEIHVATDKLAKTFTVQDTGVGMTQEEIISSLGTIARSGSKQFLQELAKGGSNSSPNSIIGQFGVGFYSAFMVSEKVEVFSQSRKPGSKAVCWSSDGSGQYEVSEAEGVQEGTKIVLHLKHDAAEFADEDSVKNTIKKYSNFVGSPIFLNGKQINTLEALWLMDPKEVTSEQHDEFYRYISSAYDVPRFTLHFRTDVPLNINCLLYVPEGKPGLFEMSRDTESGLSLYSRKVLIKNKAEILPKWLRFVKGVVDSEDIPLNLSRELLQDSALIRKIRTVITNRLSRYLYDRMNKEPESYRKFYHDYSVFLKEGILASHEQVEKEEIAKLLQFESSTKPDGDKVTLAEYCANMKEGQKDIYYLAAPSRQLAESSPYFEAVRSRDVEVLFCFEPYDELVLVQLQQFNRKNVTSIEKEMRRDVEKTEKVSDEVTEVADWLKTELSPMVHKVKVTKRLQNHPCLVSVEEMAAARHFVKTTFQSFSEEQRYKLLEPTLEINPEHAIIKKLQTLKSDNPELAKKLARQLFHNAMVAAGLVDDPRKVTVELNDLLTLLLERH
ncbi:heat shock protein 75 kDa, mitochondrial-like [Ornithodoros turicata]|uniref:heat shock protein 75 kDa, mitochondrial-like n=1 Tax=Ornithodoros turicata TaxID=34597 RepID=UPI00313A1AB4